MLRSNPIRGAVLSSPWHGSADVTKCTPLHPWRSQHQQSTGRMTRKTNEFWIYKKLEHRNRQTHPHLLVESALKVWNSIIENAPKLRRHQMNPKRKGGKVWKNEKERPLWNSISVPFPRGTINTLETGYSSRNRKGNLTSGIIIYPRMAGWFANK